MTLRAGEDVRVARAILLPAIVQRRLRKSQRLGFYFAFFNAHGKLKGRKVNETIEIY